MHCLVCFVLIKHRSQNYHKKNVNTEGEEFSHPASRDCLELVGLTQK